MSFKEKGFLGAEAQAYIADHREKFDGWFSALDQINGIAVEYLGNLQPTSEIQQITCFALYLRVVSSFSAAVKLLEYGLAKDAGTIIRSQIESVFFLKACCDDTDFVEKYHYAGEDFRRKIANLALQKAEGAIDLTEENKPKLEAIKAKIDAQRKSGEVEDLIVATVAKNYGLEAMYNTAYRVLSNNHAHSGTGSIKSYFEFGPKGEITKILWGPQLTDVDHLMYTLCAGLMVAITSMQTVFKIPEEVNDRLRAKLDKLMGSLKKEATS